MGSGASSSKSSPPKVSHANGVKTPGNHRMSLQATVASYHRNQIPPPPSPPRSSKRQEMESASHFGSTDQYVDEMPQNLNYGTFRDLVDYLMEPVETNELEKLRTLFNWVTSVDVFSVKVDREPPKNSPMEYFIKIQNNMGNHSHLLSGLCQMAGIPCEIISGMNKSAAYEIGKRADRSKMGAQWNAVYVDGNWRLIDAFWACACVVGKKSGEWTLVDADGDVVDAEEDATEGQTQHRVNEFYFIPDPDQLIWTHFPDDKRWQLLHRPVTLEEFEDHFYVRERFHILGVVGIFIESLSYRLRGIISGFDFRVCLLLDESPPKVKESRPSIGSRSVQCMSTVPDTKMKCVAETVDGEVEFIFGLPPERSQTFRFKYMLYRSKSEAADRKVDLFLDRFVFFEQREDLLRFALRFPIKGNFKLDIYGLDTEDGDVFDLCCTYIINCPKAKHNCLPLPDCPPLGWGPVAETRAAGLEPTTHKRGEVISKDGYVEIRLAKERALAFHQLLKHAKIDEATLSKYVITELEGDEAVIYLRLPQNGEYALKLFAQDLDDEGAAPNVLNYLIKCSDTETGSQPFPNLTNGLVGKNPLTSDKFGVKAVSHPSGMLETNDGKLSLDFEAAPGVDLVCEIHTNDGKAASQMTSAVTSKGDKWNFKLDMPVKGEYTLNVFAQRKGEKGQIYSVHSYLIKSAGGSVSGDQVDGLNEKDMQVPTETVETSDSEVMIPVPYGCKNAVAAVHRRNGNDPPDPSQIEFFSADDMNLVKVQLKDYGEYMLNLYSMDENANLVENVAKYQINRKRPGELYQNNLSIIMEDLQPSRQNTEVDVAVKKKGDSEEENKRQARRNIQNALDLKDIRFLEDAIKAYVASGANDNDPLLLKARHQLEVLKAKEELMEATQKRDLAVLEKAIAQAKSINTHHELDLQIALAVRLRDHLQKIEKLRHAVLNMEPKTISEIKSYANPPDGVHQCLTATFLLLGHNVKELNVWQKVQALLGKTGRESVMRKISKFDAQTVALRAAQVAKKMVEPYTKEQIRDVSAGAATFYIWALGMIEEVESYGGTEQNDQMTLRN